MNLKNYLTLAFASLMVSCSYQNVTDRHFKSSRALKAMPNVTHSSRPIPVSYLVWLESGQNQHQVEAYKAFLSSHQIKLNQIPEFELFRSARDWHRCQASPYEVPSRELWPNSLNTLKLLSKLLDEGILENIELTSNYRSAQVNQCVNGAPASSHVKNAAIDFRIGSEFPSQSEQAKIIETKTRLCRFWQNQGRDEHMGLGVYASGQIHIDTLGFRTWGPDLTWRSSICAEKVD